MFFMHRKVHRNSGKGVYRVILVVFCMVMLLAGIFTLFIESFLRPVFLAAAEQRAIQKATDAINRGVYEHAKNLKYTDLIHYQTNQQGDIILMQPDLQIVNEFVSRVTMTIQANLSGLKEEDIQIPLAQALGFQVLANLGPQITVKMVPIGVVRPPRIEDSFESAGINQTRHKIYLHVTVEIQILVPFVKKTLPVETQVPVTEVTILGKVPQVNIGIDGGTFEKLLNQSGNK